MRCAVDYTYNRIGSFVPGITLILTAEYTTDMNEDSAMLFYNYTSTLWSLDWYILVHWLAPGVFIYKYTGVK